MQISDGTDAPLSGNDGAEVLATQRRLHPVLKLLIGVIVGVGAAWLVVSTAGGLGDAVAAVGRMRPEFVVIAVAFAVLRIALFGLQFLWLGRRTGPMRIVTAKNAPAKSPCGSAARTCCA